MWLIFGLSHRDWCKVQERPKDFRNQVLGWWAQLQKGSHTWNKKWRLHLQEVRDERQLWNMGTEWLQKCPPLLQLLLWADKQTRPDCEWTVQEQETQIINVKHQSRLDKGMDIRSCDFWLAWTQEGGTDSIFLEFCFDNLVDTTLCANFNVVGVKQRWKIAAK